VAKTPVKTAAKTPAAPVAKAGASAGEELAPVQDQSLVQSLFEQDDDSPVDARDILLPRILVMQGLSKFVADDKARMGEFRDSLSAKLLGGKDAPMDFIPFYSNKTWLVFKVVKVGNSTKEEYAGTFPLTPENSNWQREAQVGTDYLKRYMCINYYVLLPSEIESNEAFPYVLSFRSSSYTAGRKLETHKVKYKAIKKPICWKTFKLTTSLTENEKGKFYVLDVEPDRLTTDEELAEVSKWTNLVKTSKVTVDDSDMAAENGGAAPSEAVDTSASDAQY
jgi:hypothetical protein